MKLLHRVGLFYLNYDDTRTCERQTSCPVWEELSYDYTKMRNETGMKGNIYPAVPEITEF